MSKFFISLISWLVSAYFVLFILCLYVHVNESNIIAKRANALLPKLNDENNKWVSYPEGSRANYIGKDSLFVRQSLPIYIRLLQDAKRTNNYTEANKILSGIKKFQQNYGKDVYPNKKKNRFRNHL